MSDVNNSYQYNDPDEDFSQKMWPQYSEYYVIRDKPLELQMKSRQDDVLDEHGVDILDGTLLLGLRLWRRLWTGLLVSWLHGRGRESPQLNTKRGMAPMMKPCVRSARTLATVVPRDSEELDIMDIRFLC